MSKGGVFGTTAACRATGLSYRQIDYWDRIGFIRPSIQEAKGEGSLRAYSEEDIRLLNLTKKLLDLGFSLQAIRYDGPDALERRVRHALNNVGSALGLVKT